MPTEMSQRILTAAHEFGHFLGITDAYGQVYGTKGHGAFIDRPTGQVPVNDMMRGGEVIKHNMVPYITENDYEMLWQAWATNNQQSFVNFERGIETSGGRTIIVKYYKSHVLDKDYL